MADDHAGSVRISTDEDGAFENVTLQDGALRAAVAAGPVPWTRPILLYGNDTAAEVAALLAGSRGPWLEARGFRDLTGSRRNELFEMEQRVDPRFYDHVAGGARNYLALLLRGEAPLQNLVDLIAVGFSGQSFLTRTGIGRDFIDLIELHCNTTGLVLPWQIKNSFLPAVVLAVWMQRPRLHPLVFHFPKRFGVPSVEGQEVAAGGIRFDALTEEAERALGMSRADVEKAYRVWQLSRVGDTTKPHATTPKTITRDVAQEFLSVAARARTDRTVAISAGPQRAAPLIFELEGIAVGLRHGASVQDTAAVVRAGATSLRRRIERLKHDTYVNNIVPSAQEIFEVAIELLGRIIKGEYGDAEIVELGLELDALQYHIDPVRKSLSDISIGELTGLFANANMFLARFVAWQEYMGAGPVSGRSDESKAAFALAQTLLESARERADFLTREASDRIGSILERTALDSEAPALREGLIRSGENLAAVTAEGLSRVAVDHAKAFGGEVRDEAYKVASKAVVSYATKNAPLLLKLGELRKWPWLTWLHHLLS